MEDQERIGVDGFESRPIIPGVIYDDRSGALPSLLSGYSASGPSDHGSEFSTTYGFVVQGSIHINLPGIFQGEACQGQYFSFAGQAVISGAGSATLFERVGVKGNFMLGGPLELQGRLAYIDGCTTSLLVYPHRLGDPILNVLWFPEQVSQTMHVHPSLRLGIVAYGHGTCDTPRGNMALRTGQAFRIEPMTPHRFITDRSQMAVVTYHPDSDWGPTDVVHPMLLQTLAPKT